MAVACAKDNLRGKQPALGQHQRELVHNTGYGPAQCPLLSVSCLLWTKPWFTCSLSHQETYVREMTRRHACLL